MLYCIQRPIYITRSQNDKPMKQVPVESAEEERIKSPRGLFYTNNNNKKEEKRDVVGINRKITPNGTQRFEPA